MRGTEGDPLAATLLSELDRDAATDTVEAIQAHVVSRHAGDPEAMLAVTLTFLEVMRRSLGETPAEMHTKWCLVAAELDAAEEMLRRASRATTLPPPS